MQFNETHVSCRVVHTDHHGVERLGTIKEILPDVHQCRIERDDDTRRRHYVHFDTLTLVPLAEPPLDPTTEA